MDAVKLLQNLLGNKSLSSGLGSQLLGGLLGGGDDQSKQQPQSSQQSQTSGLAGVLSGVLGGGNQQGSSGGLSGLMGSVLGSGGAAGISGLLGSVLGGGEPAAAATSQVAPPQQADANDQAVLMIRAMVNAAKSDGRIDADEQENIISKLGDEVSQTEADFLRQELAAPLDVAEFAASVPNGLEQQIYAISLTSIELDTQNEAQYLGQLAQGMRIDPELCNQIHDHVGAPKIFG